MPATQQASTLADELIEFLVVYVFAPLFLATATVAVGMGINPNFPDLVSWGSPPTVTVWSVIGGGAVLGIIQAWNMKRTVYPVSSFIITVLIFSFGVAIAGSIIG